MKAARTLFLAMIFLLGCGTSSNSNTPVASDATADSAVPEPHFTVETDAQGKERRYDSQHAEAGSLYCEQDSDCAYITDLDIPSCHEPCEGCKAPVCPVAYRFARGTIEQAKLCSKPKAACRKLPKVICWEHVCRAVDTENKAENSSGCVVAEDCELYYLVDPNACHDGVGVCSIKDGCEKAVLCPLLNKYAEKNVRIQARPMRANCDEGYGCRDSQWGCAQGKCLLLDPLFKMQANHCVLPADCKIGAELNAACYRACGPTEDCSSAPACEIVYRYSQRALDLAAETCASPAPCRASPVRCKDSICTAVEH